MSIQPKPVSIAAKTGMGAVHVAVTDRERALRFYRDVVGLAPLTEGADDLSLGAGGRELVRLFPGASAPVQPHRTGLYHLAIVLPNRRELARVVARLFTLRYDNYPTDHVMTKADYLSDPDGNGLEIYAETPEDGTMLMANGTFEARDKQGNLRSGRDPIDLDQLFSELAPDDRLDAPLPAGTRMGHVHLHVSDLDAAVRFYHELIGFDVMGLAPRMGAAFLSAGGYHHHLGLNTWAGPGVPPAPAGTAGLRRFSIELPARADLDQVLARLQAAGIAMSELADGGYQVSDPSANLVHLRTA